MIELRDKDKNRVAGLVDYENLCIESILESGDKTLSFYYPKKGKYYDEIVEEAYIKTKKDEFVVKARELDEDYTKFECSLNLEELEGNIFDRFESVEQTITSALNLAVVGTGWTVKDNTLKKRRTVRCTNKSSLEIVREIKKVYRVDIVFNTLGKQIEVYEHLGEDKGTYFIDSLNLIALQVQSDSRQYATRIIAEGKDGLSFSDINNGKNYVENYQYSNKVKTIYWKDERYSVKENLLEDARAKLEELSKPFRSYSASILNLAELNPRYSSILDFELGDAINLISKKNKIKDKQRIVKIIEWPQDHTKDSVELANATLKFEDIQQENQETSDTVSNITTDNGTINGSTIDSITTKQIEDFEANVIKVAKLKAILAEIENLHVNKADIQNLNAVIARIGTLEATKASITELNAIHAIIQQIKAGKADIADLNVAVAKVGILENKTAVLENALAGNLTANNFKTNAITAGSAVIAEGAIGSSQISSLSVNKLEAGDITTSKHRIVSADGTIEIVGNQILINRNNVNRVILGEYRKSDGTTEYGLLVRAKDGQTIMLDGNGVHNAGITDGAIDNNKVADNANISGNKLDINSVIREVNNNGTETIKGTKVTVGDRTLDVELSTQKNTITEHSKELSSQKASLTALDNALKFKVDSQTFTQSTETINSNITRAKEQAIIGARSIPDTRNSNESPGWYMQHYAFQTITEFKYSNVIGIPNGGSWFGTLETTVPWNNSSGGYPTQVFRSNSSPVYQRHGTDLNTWSSWEQIEDTQGSQAKANNALNNAKSYSDSKKQEAIKAAENLALEKSNLAKKYAEDVATAKANLAKTEAIANADGKISAEEKKRIQQAQENLNTAISKADKAKQDAINEANRIAELKKQEAINSSNSHADSKANEALNNAKAFVNSEITNVNTHLNKNTSEINILKGQIESKVSQSDIDKSIQNIKFNDVNMILNSGEFKDTDHWSCTNGSNNLTIENRILKFKFTNYASWGCYISNNSLLNKPLDISKKYTVVCKLKASKNQILTFNICDGNSYNYVFGKELSLTTEWQIFKFTFNPTQVGNERQFRFITSNLGYDFDLYIEFVKMVEGATSSDSWSMAPDYVLDNIKTVTDKISTVESKLTQENNSIKASVQDLNSTTQSITTNVSNINRDLTSKINSNLNAAKSFAIDIATNKANTAKQEAISSANSHADSIAVSKANEALNNAKSYTNTEINVVNTKVHNVESNIDILKNKIALKVEQSDIDKTKTELINKINVVDNLANNAKDLASAMSLGKMLFSDPTFKNSSNNIKTYNNNGNGTVTTSRISKINGCPTDSQYCIEVKTVGSASPNHGGFYFGNITRANAIFVTKIIAKIPVGLRIGWYSNSTGNNGSSKWLTSVNGTGKWEEYIHLLKCGDTGSFSSTSFFALDGGITPSTSNPIVWHLAYATVFDITENDESVNVLKTEMSTAKNKVATIETNLDSITQRVSSTESKTRSIETTLGGKASKQEVTEVNNRVATIKASLDGITQRVSATESKTQTLESNLNGKASKQEVSNVSSKVVSLETNLNGITNRVSNTESRINTLDGKVASAVTNQQFTEFKQSNDKFKFTVEQRSSVSNILPNGSFFGGDRGWLHDGVEFWYGAYSGYGFKGRMTGAIKNRTSYNNPERFLQTHKAYKVKKNTTYTISFHYACEMNIHSMEAYVVLSDTEHGDYAQPIRILEKPGGTQSDPNNEIPFTYKFNTGNHEWVWLRFDHNGMKPGTNWDQYCWLYVSEIGIYEGDVGAVKWTPKGGEVYSANYQMDGLGFKGTFEDGTYASLGKDGLEWYNAGTGHAYHALTYVTSFDIPVGNPGKAYIKLPAEFTKRRSSLKWTVALRGYYYSTSGNFFPFHVHCTGARDYIENGLIVCEVQGLCKIQNGSNSGDLQFRPLTAMLIAIA
ncbi:phage tail spike protein [Clostridium perfringens]|uniref:phage tail spike protein n=1 Tax=Clostridium perfringens TaxID=1502 RepID=UPI0024BC1B35|nr:phage tail spike protein [Clostridium perfringens]